MKLRRKLALLTLVLGPALLCVDSASAQQMPLPSQWQELNGVTPLIDGWANGIRISGLDRYDVALTASMTLRGAGDYPFDTPDPSSGGASGLAKAADWWGLGTCPNSFLLVAGDVAADSLVAASLSDPTDKSNEPFLRRSAAADPLFDPVGGYRRVDTHGAPIIVTASSRSGANSLSQAAVAAITDLRSGGCRSACSAIIVGGPEAVASDIEDELIELGMTEVFRVAGDNRYETAANIAQSMGLAPVPNSVSNCSDPFADDGDIVQAFYANSVVEWRATAGECRLLGGTVVLADGVVGADALAASWWTSYWQVPVLLHDGTRRLPAATVDALRSLLVSNIIVLGGESRIPTFVVRSAERLSGASSQRIAGHDRYETSVMMAKHLGGWFPTGRGEEFRSSTVCLVASGSPQDEIAAWSDALAAGPWCGKASASLREGGSPTRALLPLSGAHPRLSHPDSISGHSTVPILLTEAGSDRLPDSVANFLRNSFEPADAWCSSITTFTSCTDPGFVVAFGEAQHLPDSAVSHAASIVSGGVESPYGIGSPQLNQPFLTGLDMSPVYREARSGNMKFCLDRGGYPSSRWIAMGFQGESEVESSVDLMTDSWYLRDADGISRSGQVGSPGCIRFTPRLQTNPWVKAVGISGRSSQVSGAATQLRDRISMTGPVAVQSIAEGSGDDSTVLNQTGGEYVAVFLSTRPQTGVIVDGFVSLIDSAGLTLQFESTFQSNRIYPTTFNATWTLNTPRGILYGEAAGEAIKQGEYWRLRGRSRVAVGPLNSLESAGGFVADLNVGAPGNDDDSISWRLDAVPTYALN